MVQSGSSGQSSMPPYVHAFDTKALLKCAVWLIAFGALFYWMTTENSEQDKNLDANQRQTTDLPFEY